MTFFSKSSKKRFSHLCRQVLKVFREFYYDSIAHSPATGHLNKKAVNKTEMLWKHLWECVVSFCSCDCTLFQERGIFYLVFLKVFGWGSKLSLASWFSPSNATFSFFLIQNLSIRNMYIYGVLELVKGDIFLHTLPSDLPKTSETFFRMLCPALFLYLKSINNPINPILLYIRTHHS